MTSFARLDAVAAAARPVRGRRSLTIALEEAGLGTAPIVVADTAVTERAATTIKVTRAAPVVERAEVATARAELADETEEIVLTALEIDEAETAGDDIWSLDMAPPPPWLRPQRAHRRSRWRGALVTCAAWLATLLITGGIIGGVGYGLTRSAPIAQSAR